MKYKSDIKNTKNNTHNPDYIIFHTFFITPFITSHVKGKSKIMTFLYLSNTATTA